MRTRRDLLCLGAALVLAALGLVATVDGGEQQPLRPQQQAQAAPNAPGFRAGEGGELVKLPLPDPQPFKTEDGKKGWRLKVPGGRPLATPAVVDGVLYVGGGFGSHEFYALDAKTGRRIWTCRTDDDGPTAAVVDEGYVAYNTESCTLIVHDAKTGRVLWHRWLGDPLMSQPAIAGGRLFMAYPGKDRSHHLVAFRLKTGKVLWDHKIAAEIISAPVVEGRSVYAATVDGTLYHFDAKSGKLHWSKKCNVTSAPRVVKERIYISQRAVKKIEIEVGKGKKAKKTTSECTVEGFNVVDAKTGKSAFDEPRAAVRAAYLLTPRLARAAEISNVASAFWSQRAYRGRVADLAEDYFGDFDEDEVGEVQKRLSELKKRPASEDPAQGARDAEEALVLAKELESLRRVAAKSKKPQLKEKGRALGKIAEQVRAAAEKAKTAALTALNVRSVRGAIEAEQKAAQKLDAGVGFTEAPAAAELFTAADNIGQENVKAVWGFQGSRPHVLGSRCISVSGDRFRSVDAATGKVVWESKIQSKVEATRPATPAALAGGKFYLGTADGRILCVNPNTGETLWRAKVGGRILFEPAVVGGRVYVATDDGTLICLETGDPTADGWPMWGGSARHNGLERR